MKIKRDSSKYKETFFLNIITLTMQTPSTSITTLSAHILTTQQTVQGSGDFSILISAIASSCKWISNCVRKADLLNVIGLTGNSNIQQEQVQKLDILSNNIFIQMLKTTNRAQLLVSEEVDSTIKLESTRGNYFVAFDPLDGSSNIDCGVSIGTIFGIWKEDVDSPLRKGEDMVAAGYCLYGSSTVLVLTMGKQVNVYTLDPSIGEFLLTHPDIKIGSKKIYSVNEGNARSFPKPVDLFIEECKDKKYSARYVGSMVADVHRTLLYGGVFLYPTRKLRMLYECFPMAMIIEAAGGLASDGKQRILDKVPKDIHERCEIFLGSKDMVERIEELYRQ